MPKQEVNPTAAERCQTPFKLERASGRVTPARFVPSPNCDPRPDSTAIEVLVIHAISLPPRCYGGDFIEQLFTNRLDVDAHPYFAKLREMKVSAHFLIRRSGELLQFVPLQMRAWHAGVSDFRGRQQVNDFSLGICTSSETSGTLNPPPLSFPHTPPPSFPHPSAVIPALFRRHSCTPPLSFPQSLSGNPCIGLCRRYLSAVTPPCCHSRSLLSGNDHIGLCQRVIQLHANWIRRPIWASVPLHRCHKHLLFCDLPLSTATGSTTTGPTGWSTTTPKYPSFPLATIPIQYFIHQ